MDGFSIQDNLKTLKSIMLISVSETGTDEEEIRRNVKHWVQMIENTQKPSSKTLKSPNTKTLFLVK